MPAPGGSREPSHNEEVIVAVLLSLAALASSWCGYQSARWTGVQTMHYSKSVSARTQSVSAAGTANQLMAVDIGLFTNWLDAMAMNRTVLADFYRARFRDEFKAAFDAWRVTRPLENPHAPPSPFRLPQYRLADAVRATDLSGEADRQFDLAQEANQQSDDYVLTSVVLSSVLFLGGIAGNFEQHTVRWGMMTVASLLLLFGLYNILVYPVA